MTSPLDALGDETRRQALLHLASEGALTATEMAARLGISRQGASKHLRKLHDCGLAKRVDTAYGIRTEALKEASEWIASVERQWDARLARLKRFVESE